MDVPLESVNQGGFNWTWGYAVSILVLMDVPLESGMDEYE